MNSFDHDKLDVYRACIEFVALADDIVEQLPRGRILVEATCYDEARGLRLRIVSLLVRMYRNRGIVGIGKSQGTASWSLT